MRTLLFALLLAAACADPGPRDRSLLDAGGPGGPDASGGVHASAEPEDEAGEDEEPELVPDPLANYYSEEAELVLRFEPTATLERLWKPEWDRLRAAVPALDAVELDLAAAVRRLLDLPDGVRFDAVRPFALVKLESGWVGVLPSRSAEAAGPRLRPLDAVYAVAGDPALVGSYEPRFRQGLHCPGQVGVIGKPAAIARLGSALAPLAARAGIDLALLDALVPEAPTDVERVDLVFGVHQDAARVDLRLGVRPGSPTARILAGLRPSAAASQRWLPDGGELYVELAEAPLRLEALLLGLWHGRSRRVPTAVRHGFDLVRPLLAALGEDAAIGFELDAHGAGTATLIASLEDPDATRAYLDSAGFRRLLERIAGDEAALDWTPRAFERDGRPVGTVAGSISRSRILAWRQSRDPLLATLSVFLGGPAVVYIAVVDDRLAVVCGAAGQNDAARVLDHLVKGEAADNDHAREVAPLFPERLAAASVDLAGLFDGCREAAPFWPGRGPELEDEALHERLPASVAVTARGDALRAAARVRPHRLAAALLRLRAALGDG